MCEEATHVKNGPVLLSKSALVRLNLARPSYKTVPATASVTNGAKETILEKRRIAEGAVGIGGQQMSTRASRC